MRVNWSGCMEMRMWFLVMKAPICSSCLWKWLCQLNVLAGWDANGTRSELIRRNSNRCFTLNCRIRWRQVRLFWVVSLRRASE